jgi:hypothetical protein
MNVKTEILKINKNKWHVKNIICWLNNILFMLYHDFANQKEFLSVY